MQRRQTTSTHLSVHFRHGFDLDHHEEGKDETSIVPDWDRLLGPSQATGEENEDMMTVQESNCIYIQ